MSQTFDRSNAAEATKMDPAAIADILHAAPKAKVAPTGLERLIGASHVSYERLPMLEIVFDRLVRLLTTSLRNFTSDNVDVGMERLISQRFGDTLDSIPDNAMFAVFKAEEWENYGILILSSSLVYMVIDALLGGGNKRTDTSALDHRERRRHTTIERALIEPLVRTILTDLGRSFSPLCAVTFRFERLELNSRFAAISRAANGVVSAKFSIEMGGRGGDVDLILPHATLEPVREVLLQQFMGEKFGHDTTWEQHLAQELWHTDIELDVVFDEQVMRLRDIVELKPGQQLMLQYRGSRSARLRCGSKSLFEGRIGQRKGRMALKIENRLDDRPIVNELDETTPTESVDNG